MKKPEPLVPADYDVSDLDSFMLNVEKLLGSELVALGTPEECWAAMMLWCRAWKQMPGGSLPNDDRILAKFSGAGDRWFDVKEIAMRGFVLCSDGRLYHRTLCKEVKKAYARKVLYREKRDKDRERLQRHRAMKRVSNIVSLRDATRFVREDTGTGIDSDTPYLAQNAPDELPLDQAPPPDRNTPNPTPGTRARILPDPREPGEPQKKYVQSVGQQQNSVKKQMWDMGVAMLGKGSRGLIGKFSKEHGEVVVLRALVATEDACPAAPMAYFIRTIEGMTAAPAKKVYVGG